MSSQISEYTQKLLVLTITLIFFFYIFQLKKMNCMIYITKYIYPCLPVHVEHRDLVLVAGSVLEGDDLGLPLLRRDLYDRGQMMRRTR